MNHPTNTGTPTVGDVIIYGGVPCRISRVTDCAASVAISQPKKTFSTVEGKVVGFQPPPVVVRISPQSEVPIVSRA